MQLKSLTLAALGLLLVNSEKFAQAASVLNEDAIANGGVDFSLSYLSVYSSDDDKEADFILSNEAVPAHLAKRGDTCTKYHTVSGSDSCVSLASKYDVSLSDIYKWNPQVEKDCSNLNNGKKYCVAVSSSSSTTARAVSAASVTSKTEISTKKTSSTEVRKKLQTKSAFTYYWIAQESDYSGGGSTTIKTCSGDTIGKVDGNYADALVMEGTGVVGSKVVNLGSCDCKGYKCFELVNKSTDPYGLTSYGSALRPYITIASNDIAKNTKIYVPALAGWELPGTKQKHNGCLLVDDQSWSFTNKHIDFYVYKKDNYQTLDKLHKITSVDIYEGGSCKLLNYNL